MMAEREVVRRDGFNVRRRPRPTAWPEWVAALAGAGAGWLVVVVQIGVDWHRPWGPMLVWTNGPGWNAYLREVFAEKLVFAVALAVCNAAAIVALLVLVSERARPLHRNIALLLVLASPLLGWALGRTWTGGPTGSLGLVAEAADPEVMRWMIVLPLVGLVRVPLWLGWRLAAERRPGAVAVLVVLVTATALAGRNGRWVVVALIDGAIVDLVRRWTLVVLDEMGWGRSLRPAERPGLR